MEKNWGNQFPNHWIWAQGLNVTRKNPSLQLQSDASPNSRAPVKSYFALAGGETGIPLAPDSYLLKYRSSSGLELAWSPLDNFNPRKRLKMDVQSCNGFLKVEGRQRHLRLTITIQAPKVSQ
jgi:hypothetical protein